MGRDLPMTSRLLESWREIQGVWWLKFVVIERWDDLIVDDVRRCGFANALPRDFEGVFVLDKDCGGGQGLFFQSGIRMNCGNGRLGGRTYVLLLILIEEAAISTTYKDGGGYIVVGVVSIH